MMSQHANPEPIKTPQEITCSHCGKKFRAAPTARYCSAACKQAAYRLRRDRKNAKRVTP